MNRVLELALASFRYKHGFAFSDPLRHISFNVTRRPTGDHGSGKGGIFRSAEQMIGLVQRDETLWMFCRRENRRGIVNADSGIDGRMQDHEGFPHVRNMLGQGFFTHIIQKLLPDCKCPPCKLDHGLPIALYIFDLRPEIFYDMRHISRRTDRRNGSDFRYGLRNSQNGCSTQGVTDQYLRCGEI